MAAVLSADLSVNLKGARTDLVCPECGALMALRPSKYGPFYGCVTFPTCKGSHGAHPDGAPMGTPANRATKQARILAHEGLDALWKSGRMSRNHAYRWMRQALKIPKSQAHIGKFSLERCGELMTALQALDRASKEQYDTVTPSP